ncbi:unnamed protein product [Linum tenue]|uniref:Uncharacterized protein n=1 Tax=Linum tenue TaxID=586396 RepID=A0AAV0JDP8_9ROSI|nr:unnamed protein product [Linum tenue]
MASSSNVAAALFLLFLALFSTAAHGRESHFFSRVAANTNNVDPNAVNNGQPSFVQETENNGYGIYDHQNPEETASFDQTATNTKLTSFPTKSFRPYNAQTNSDDTFRNGNANNNEKYYNNDRYSGESGYNGDNNHDEQEKFGETSLKQQDATGYQKSGWDFGNSGYEFFP